MDRLLFVGMGGFVGAVTRYMVLTWTLPWFGTRTFLGVMLVNASGSFLLGMLVAWFAHAADFPTNVRLLLATGFFGAYTTFSTYAVESIELLRANQWVDFAVNVIGHNVLSLAAALFGVWLFQQLFVH